MPYRSLDRSKIIQTAERLELRIGERFPKSSLRNVSAELVSLAQDLAVETEKLEQPILWLRALIVLVIVSGAVTFAFFGTFFSFERLAGNASDFVQGLEALINTAIFAAVGLYTLVTFEERIKRRRALDQLHALRSIIHIIDMHQLTKDPTLSRGTLKPTDNSPRRTLTADELKRYLDYCSELLSITGKLAALFAQTLNDGVVVQTVNDIENLGTNLSRKIWQKIMLVRDEENATSKPPRSRKKA
jgi:type II secretory pathway pseudopilin PulG